MKNRILMSTVVGMLAIWGQAAYAAVDHLLLTEVGFDTYLESETASSEYVEILNPTLNPISLNNYYLSDSNFYTSITTSPLINTGSKDNILRFPQGYTLQPGQMAVVTQNADTFAAEMFDGDLANFAGQVNSPLLFETINSSSGVPDMISLNNGGSNENQRRNLRLNNTTEGGLGEFMMLFYWDGASPRVKDVDLVGWGFAVDPEGYKLKGPHVKGSDNSSYAVDAGPRFNTAFVVDKPLIKRRFGGTGGELAEVQTGGNGITGHDESTENMANSWNDYTFSGRSPGVIEIPLGGTHNPPEFSTGQRSPVNPGSGDAVTLSALVVDTGGSISDVKFYVDSGSGFTTLTATNNSGNTYQTTVGPYPDDTAVRWYMEATDNSGTKARMPAAAPFDFNAFYVDNETMTSGALTFNEILYDNMGADAYEFVEIYNNSNAPVKLPYFRFNTKDGNNFRLPAYTAIPGNGYLVLTSNPTELANHYTIPVDAQVIDWGLYELGNVDRLTLQHVNQVPFGSLLADVSYTNTSPWPVTNVVLSDQTIELKSHDLESSNGENWTTSVNTGTPGKTNSNIPDPPTETAASGWELY